MLCTHWLLASANQVTSFVHVNFVSPVSPVSPVTEHVHEKSSNNSEKEAESEGQQYKLPLEYSQ